MKHLLYKCIILSILCYVTSKVLYSINQGYIAFCCMINNLIFLVLSSILLFFAENSLKGVYNEVQEGAYI